MVLNEPETIMAMRNEKVILGVDVSQQWLDYCRYGCDQVERIDNSRREIDRWLKSLPATAALAVEATNYYHELLVDRARHFGLAVYLISGYQLRHYAESLNTRMRNDAVDAQLLARFLDREIDALRPYQPKSPKHQQIVRLLKRRALVVKQIQQLRQSFEVLPQLNASVRSLVNHQRQLLKIIDGKAQRLARQLGWSDDLARLRSAPGIGPLNALALCAAFHSGDFTHRDPFIAYLGLDVRTKDSGQHRGRRKLTKKGPAECRRLLHNAAMAAVRTNDYFKSYYLKLQARSLSKTAALVAVARKIARLAFSLLRHRTTFQPTRLPCAST